MKKTVLFDLDGTLADTLADIRSALNYALGVYDYPERTVSQVREYIGTGARDLIRKALPENARSDEIIDWVLSTYSARYYEYYLVDTHPYDGLPELIHRLAEKGISLGVVTNKPDAHAHKLIERFFGNDFGFVLGSGGDLPVKPNPAMPRYAMEQLGADAAQTLFVGDSDVDIKTARNAGLPGIIVTWGFCDLDELKQNGAEYLVDTPAELEAKIIELLHL